MPDDPIEQANEEELARQEADRIEREKDEAAIEKESERVFIDDLMKGIADKDDPFKSLGGRR